MSDLEGQWLHSSWSALSVPQATASSICDQETQAPACGARVEEPKTPGWVQILKIA